MSNKTFTLLVDDYIKYLKYSKLIILPQMISKKEQKQKKLTTIIENLPKNEKALFIYGELQCMESQKKIKELIIQNQNIIKLCKNFFQNLSNLIFLDLSNNSILKISKKILKFPNLRHLLFNNNLISVIPFFLSELNFLEEIQLENNVVQLVPINIQNFPCLKTLNLTNNKLDQIPVELGLIKNLEILLFDKNSFVEIPTSLCYLKKLKRIKLEWFEYVHPSIDIDLKDMNLIHSFKLVLKEQLLQSKIFIDFHTFLLKFSQDKLMDESINTFETEKTECYNTSSFDIFHALNNNYLGVIKSFIKDNPDIINSRDQNRKTPLYLAIQKGRRDICEYLLGKINIKKLEKENYSHNLLFKAIRMWNFPLVVKLNNLGISLDKLDEKGNNAFHILFSVFINNYVQCTQIGNYLIENGLDNYNNKNKDGWAPIHIAAQYGNVVCLEWIGYINKILEKKNKKIIDVNFRGKKNWTALHLVVASHKYSEFIDLLNLGSDVLARNSEGKTPRYITNNFFLSKMLYKKEYDLYLNKYVLKTNNKLENDKERNKIKIRKYSYYSYKLNENKNNNENKDNLIKDLVSNNDKNFKLNEKYNSITMLALDDNKNEVQKECKEILSKIDFSKKYNHIIISDILGIICHYNLTKMIQDLNKLLELKKNDINSNIFLLREFNNTIKYLEQVKCGKINIVTKINIYFNTNNDINKEVNDNKKGNKDNIILKKPGTNSEIKSFKRGGDEINFSKYMRSKFLKNISKTTNKKIIPLDGKMKNNGIDIGKKFSYDMKKLEEKQIYESLNSGEFELDDTIKNY